MSYLYIAPLKDKTAFKIGQSNSPMKRLTTLAQFYPFDDRHFTIFNCFTTTNSYQLESVLHGFLRDKQVVFENDGGTEFFEYSQLEDILTICHAIAKLKGYKLHVFVPDPTVKPPTPHQLVTHQFINRVKSKRLELNLTQRDLAKLSKISRNTIQRFENTGNATFPAVIKILAVLGLDKELLKIKTFTPLRKRARTRTIFVGDNDHEPDKAWTQEIPA